MLPLKYKISQFLVKMVTEVNTSFGKKAVHPTVPNHSTIGNKYIDRKQESCATWPHPPYGLICKGEFKGMARDGRLINGQKP